MPSSDAPLSISRVALIVNDLDRMADFYRATIGLTPLSGDAGEVVLGAGARPLLVLRRDPAARPRPREAGLFHTAFLLPDRRALARWLGHAARTGTTLDGASDHLVSEALYLRDPEGNGIEIYADRPRSDWQAGPQGVRMDSLPLNLQDLLAAADGPWQGAPDDSVIGHVHLQVGNIAEAEAFYTGPLGMQRMAHVPGASFFATGGYHHHLAGNVWHSRGAGPRSPDATGLAEVVLAADPDRLAALGTDRLRDPWGTQFLIEARENRG